MSRVWLVRAGREGEREDFALRSGLATIQWSELGDLSRFPSKQDIQDELAIQHQDANIFRLRNWAGQLWAFYANISIGDIIAMPLKKRAAVAIGRVMGGYRFREDLKNEDSSQTREAKWIQPDFPRTGIEKDLLNSLGAFLTVAEISRNNAASRFEVLIGGVSPENRVTQNEASCGDEVPQAEATIEQDLERVSRDAIVELVGRSFKAHDLERLVAAVLEADGYHVDQTRMGADGGVDLLVRRGELGFDAPRICVQVKSSAYPEDVKTIRELQGALNNFGADHGLFV